MSENIIAGVFRNDERGQNRKIKKKTNSYNNTTEFFNNIAYTLFYYMIKN